MQVVLLLTVLSAVSISFAASLGDLKETDGKDKFTDTRTNKTLAARMTPSVANDCGGWIRVTATSPGLLRSPVDATTWNYPNSASCVWLVSGPTGRRLKFTQDPLLTFGIAESCSLDRLTINNVDYCNTNVLSSATISASTTVSCSNPVT